MLRPDGKTNIAERQPDDVLNAGTPLSYRRQRFVAIVFATRRRPAHGLPRFQAAGNGLRTRAQPPDAG